MLFLLVLRTLPFRLMVGPIPLNSWSFGKHRNRTLFRQVPVEKAKGGMWL